MENVHTNFGDEDVLRSDVSALTSCCNSQRTGELLRGARFAALRLFFGCVRCGEFFIAAS